MQEKNLIQTLWDIRGEVDKAIYDKEYSKLVDLCAQVEEIYRKNLHLETGASYTLGAYTTPSIEPEHYRNCNFETIIRNIRNIRDKYYSHENCPHKYGYTPNCILEYAWVCRAIFDKFEHNVQNNKGTTETNVILAEEAINKLGMALNEYCELTDDEIKTIQQLRAQIRFRKEQVYGDYKSTTNWDKIITDI